MAYCENTTSQGGGGFLRTKKVAAVNEGGETEGFVCKWLLQEQGECCWKRDAGSSLLD